MIFFNETGAVYLQRLWCSGILERATDWLIRGHTTRTDVVDPFEGIASIQGP
jgi:hypothetical protein